MTCSVVIATRDRRDDLRDLLTSMGQQHYPLLEVLIVDASEPPIEDEFFRPFDTLRMQIIRSEPALSKQRNAGVRHASGDVIFVCDDDMEIPDDYVGTLMNFLEHRPDSGAVTGILVEKWDDKSTAEFPPLGKFRLIWNSLFMLSIWADLRQWQARGPMGPVLQLLKRHYSRRPNRASPAGWPRVTRVEEPFFNTPFYGLGASLVRRAWLVRSPYDEILDEFGIGDHYGVALGFPGTESIAVVTDARAFHKRSKKNRLPDSISSFRRILALDYFRVLSQGHALPGRVLLLWSLTGLAIPALFRNNISQLRSILCAGWKIITDANPYLEAKREGKVGPINPLPW